VNPLPDAIRDLQAAVIVVPTLLAGLDPDDLRARPGAEDWSLLEILHHLADEEREDFPLRLRLTLEDPARAWPPIDPPAWVAARSYNERNPDEVLALFLDARRENLGWLRSLKEPAWDNTHAHPSLGPMSALRLLQAWRAHDLLHLRQMLHRRWWLLERGAGAGELAYAGNW
jgi:hypothetical protein